jgi:hypothetical protein
VRGDYKLESVVNGISIIPHKRWHVPPFIAHPGQGLIVYPLIVVGLYYKGSGHLAESPGSSFGTQSLVAVLCPQFCFLIGLLIRGDRSCPLL